MIFPRLENKSVRAQVVYEIERMIFSGQLKDGDKLTPEREMAAAMGVSRSLLNLAILDLESKGFLQVIPRKGTYVKDYKKESTPQILLSLISHSNEFTSYNLFSNLIDVRYLLEGECARLAALHATDEELQLLEKTLFEMESSSRLNRVEFIKSNFKFHHTLCSISGNIIYAMFFKSFESAFHYFLEQVFVDNERCIRSVDLHKLFFNALKVKDPENAKNIMLNILVGINVLREQYKVTGKPDTL